MDKATILALMVTAKTPSGPNSWETLLAAYAEQLEALAPKLTEEELFRLTAIGAAIYRRWCQHAESERETAEALLRLVGKGPLR